MFNALSSYQLFKYLENKLNNDINNNNILEPLCVIFRLSILQFRTKGTKLSIKNNTINYQEPTYEQGIIRYWEGDCREDLHNLYHPILKCIQWYPYEEYKILYDECVHGLCYLNDVYDSNSTIKHTISHYINVIHYNDNDEYKKKVKFNPIIDSLKDIWTKEELDSAISLLKLIKSDTNKDLYMGSLIHILENKEKYVHDYIIKISTQYQS